MRRERLIGSIIISRRSSAEDHTLKNNYTCSANLHYLYDYILHMYSYFEIYDVLFHVYVFH